MRAIERRLSHLEGLIPPPLTYLRFASHVSECARNGSVSPGSALVSVIEGLSQRDLDLLLEEVEGKLPVRVDDGAPGAIRSDAIEAGFSPADADLFVRHFGECE